MRDICDGLELEGCMSGRMAMNTPWEVAKIDREVFGDYSQDTPSREEILIDYADFAQAEHDQAKEDGWHLSYSILVRPLINLFAGEYQGSQFRGYLTGEAAKKNSGKNIKQIILDTVKFYKEIHPEAMESRNGVKVVKPTWQIE